MKIVSKLKKENGFDFEAFEFFTRSEVLKSGANILERFIEEMVKKFSNTRVICTCGETMRNIGKRTKRIKTVLGEIKYCRPFYRCNKCGRYLFNVDRILGLTKTGCSPGAQKLISHAGSRESYKEASDDLALYSNLKITQKEVERITKKIGFEVEEWLQKEATVIQVTDAYGKQELEESGYIDTLYISFDGTGVPMRLSEMKGVKGKQEDGSAKTREVKLGCIFTQTKPDEKGNPQRDPYSTSYVGKIENSQEFGDRIYRESLRRGLRKSRRIVCITDGAQYNKSIISQYFPNSIHIIDIYHSKEKIYNLSKILLKENDGELKKWLKLLEKGSIDKMIIRIKENLPRSGLKRKGAISLLNYFEQNKKQMKYRKYKKQNLFVGSGVVEAGCKTVIGKRLKNSGMFWSKEGANAVIALRCVLYSGRFEEFWESKTA